MKEPELYQCIALSTSHISLETMQYLDSLSPGDTPFTVMKRDEGFFIKLHTHYQDNLIKSLPNDIAHLIAFALDMDCLLIELDRDAKVYDHLNTYEW
tara:strand:- start:4885 stop:5175 length:291 start_codon:yes stop_codon:yes gene_type:complete